MLCTPDMSLHVNKLTYYWDVNYFASYEAGKALCHMYSRSILSHALGSHSWYSNWVTSFWNRTSSFSNSMLHFSNCVLFFSNWILLISNWSTAFSNRILSFSNWALSFWNWLQNGVDQRRTMWAVRSLQDCKIRKTTDNKRVTNEALTPPAQGDWCTPCGFYGISFLFTGRISPFLI